MTTPIGASASPLSDGAETGAETGAPITIITGVPLSELHSVDGEHLSGGQTSAHVFHSAVPSEP
jgi:hypothetical protein